MASHIYADLIATSIEKNADRTCITVKRNGEWKVWTYADLGSACNGVRAFLGSLHTSRTSSIVLIGYNIPEWIVAYHGILLAGARVVPIDPNLPSAEITEIVRLTQPLAVFCSQAFEPLFCELARTSAGPLAVVSLDGPGSALVQTFSSVTSSEAPLPNPVQFSPNDPCAILFTSGTTGKAKGAVLLQRNLTAVPAYGVQRMNVTSKDVIAAILPLHHVFGFAGCIAATLPLGASIVCVPVIKGPLILEALNERKVTLLPAVPQMLELFYDNIMRKVGARGIIVKGVFSLLQLVSATAGQMLGISFRRKLFASVHNGFGGSLRSFVSGGSSLKKRYFDGFRRMGFGIVEGYGLTETCGPIALCPAADARQGSVGPIFEEHELRIDNPDKDGRGEVLLKGLTIFGGYYNNQAATDAVFDAQGWFRTGDLGRVSPDGFLYLTGRSKDLIVLDSGKNVYPDELEEFFSRSECFEEIGVLGIDIQGSETVGAVIVPAADLRRKYGPERITELIQNELLRLGKSLPTYKKIAAFVISLSPLPRTSTRKIIKPQLRILYEKLSKKGGRHELGTGRLSFIETAQMDSAEYNTVVKIIGGLSRQALPEGITPRTHLEFDLQIDSLKKLDLVGALEQHYNIELPLEELARQESLGTLVTLVQSLIENRTTQPGLSGRVATPPQQSALPNLCENTTLSIHIAAHIVRLVSRLLWQTRWVFSQPLPSGVPLIYISNHQSLIDGPWVFCGLPAQQRKRTFVVGKIELTAIPLLWFLLKRWNQISVDRGGDVAQTMRGSKAVLNSGYNLLLFPEGTRSVSETMGPFKSGVGSLMLETGARAVPVRISGAGKIWPKGKFPRLVRTAGTPPTVYYGGAVSVQDLIDRGLVDQSPTADTIAAALRTIIAQDQLM